MFQCHTRFHSRLYPFEGCDVPVSYPVSYWFLTRFIPLDLISAQIVFWELWLCTLLCFPEYPMNCNGYSCCLCSHGFIFCCIVVVAFLVGYPVSYPVHRSWFHTRFHTQCLVDGFIPCLKRRFHTAENAVANGRWFHTCLHHMVSYPVSYLGFLLGFMSCFHIWGFA